MLCKPVHQLDQYVQPTVESAPAGRAPVSEKTDNSAAIIQKQTAIFHWEDMCYDIKIKGEDRRILEAIAGA